jgi:hypothetical protein
MNVAYPIIDADGHVLEKDRELHDYLGGHYTSAPRFETYSYFPSLDGWNRGTGVPGKDPETPAPRWLEFLDELGIHATVLYPTGGLALGLIQNPEWACARKSVLPSPSRVNHRLSLCPVRSSNAVTRRHASSALSSGW